MKSTDDLIKQSVKTFLDAQSLRGENYRETPARVLRTWKTLLNTPEPVLKTFPLQGKASLILVKDYISWSFCPHHLLPVKYTFKIGYIPFHKVVGLSKLPRVADYVLRTLPLQEDVTGLVTTYLKEKIEPVGCGCIVKGEHMCMQMRGIRSHCVSAMSSNMRGMFLHDPHTREEFMKL